MQTKDWPCVASLQWQIKIVSSNFFNRHVINFIASHKDVLLHLLIIIAFVLNFLLFFLPLYLLKFISLIFLSFCLHIKHHTHWLIFNRWKGRQWNYNVKQEHNISSSSYCLGRVEFHHHRNLKLHTIYGESMKAPHRPSFFLSSHQENNGWNSPVWNTFH